MLEQPHLLIAGTTGSGKSVVVNGLITTLLYKYPTDFEGSAQMILIDPKRVELSPYKNLPHTIYYASEPADMLMALQLAMDICNERYMKMQERKERKYTGGDIYVIIDEWADLMNTQRRDVAPLVQRLAQIGRASKVHVVLCTQCVLSKDKVLPSEIKCNFDSRLGLHTRSAQDSRNIIDKSGLELLPKYGYGQYMTPSVDKKVRIPYVDEAEQNRLIEWWENQMPQSEGRRFVLW
jgi:S-DNA-T family DNA segregation ATPase FtsK/SpoIIIE